MLVFCGSVWNIILNAFTISIAEDSLSCDTVDSISSDEIKPEESVELYGSVIFGKEDGIDCGSELWFSVNELIVGFVGSFTSLILNCLPRTVIPHPVWDFEY